MCQSKRIGYINSLKGIASVNIVLHHFVLNIGIPEIPISMIQQYMAWCGKYGYLGVELFYFLSGYLILEHYNSRIRKMSLYSFLKKRFLKLYPVLFINTLLMFVYAKPSILKVVRNLLFLQAGYYAAYDSYGNITFMDDWGGSDMVFSAVNSMLCGILLYYKILSGGNLYGVICNINIDRDNHFGSWLGVSFF